MDRVCEDVVAEHLSELSSLLARRDGIVFSRFWTAVQLARLDARIEAHRDALAIAGSHAAGLAKAAFASGEPESPIEAASLVLAASGPADAEMVFAHFEARPAPVRRRIRAALRHAPPSAVAGPLLRLAESKDVGVRAAAIDVLAFHRSKPQPRMNDLVVHPDDDVRRLVYGAIGRYGGPWSSDLLESSLDLDPPELRVLALEASARLRLPALVTLCRKYGTRSGKPVPEALAFVGVVAGADAVGFLTPLLAHPELGRTAARACGTLGYAAAIPALLDAMKSPAIAAAAAGAFARITGASGVAADPPEEPVFPEADPPAFDAERAATFWSEQSARFAAARRYQKGNDAPEGDDTLPLAWRRDEHLRRVYAGTEPPDIDLERLGARVILGGPS
jgi:uncharacterized protein (TIGR02270 family)